MFIHRPGAHGEGCAHALGFILQAAVVDPHFSANQPSPSRYPGFSTPSSRLFCHGALLFSIFVGLLVLTSYQPRIDPVTRAKLSFNEPAVRRPLSSLTRSYALNIRYNSPGSRMSSWRRSLVEPPTLSTTRRNTFRSVRISRPTQSATLADFVALCGNQSLMKLCAERRRMYRERWAKLGSKVGKVYTVDPPLDEADQRTR